MFFFLVIAVTTSTMLIVLIQNFLHNLLLNIKPNWSVCDKRKITFLCILFPIVAGEGLQNVQYNKTG